MVTCGPFAPAVLAASVLLGTAAGTAGQTAAVLPDSENFRAAPSAAVLATLRKGAELSVGERQSRWRAGTLEGWIWAASVRREPAAGHDLVVSADGGENLRATRNGRIVARLHEGMRLDRVEEDGRWIRVRRAGWIWEPSLRIAAASAPSAKAPSRPPERTVDTGAAAAATAGPRPRATSPAPGQPDDENQDGAAGAASRVVGFVRTGSRSVAVLQNPSGDTLATVRPRGTVEVTARQGRWARVRVEGWVLESALAPGDTAGAGPALTIDVATLQADPDRYRGSLVQWTVQFIALQTAEAFRRDFVEGEPFILARIPGDDAGFVYVAVPPDRLEEVKKLEPLQRLRILARVRTASSALTAAPVLDLLEITSSS